MTLFYLQDILNECNSLEKFTFAKTTDSKDRNTLIFDFGSFQGRVGWFTDPEPSSKQIKE